MSRNAKINTLLLVVVATLAALPLVLGLGADEEQPFAGADGKAQHAIGEVEPDYEPWFSPLYQPPSAEVESALFALQAAVGAGGLAYYLGLRRGRRQGAARVSTGGGAPVAEPPAGTGDAPPVEAHSKAPPDGGTDDAPAGES